MNQGTKGGGFNRPRPHIQFLVRELTDGFQGPTFFAQGQLDAVAPPATLSHNFPTIAPPGGLPPRHVIQVLNRFR